MNLQPAKKHESITVLLVPYDGYSAFPRAVDAILRETRLPFELIIIEGCAPDTIRHELEKRRERRKNIKIIYSNHRPRLAEAFNLGLPHIRTDKAFLMHNNLLVTPQWLETLMQHVMDKPRVICPYVPVEHGERPKNPFDMDMQAFLITRGILNYLGKFDERVASPLLSVDLAQQLNKHGISIHRDPYTILENSVSTSPKPFDLKLFHRQWDEKHLRDALVYVNTKWNINLQESKYQAWLQKKKHPQQKNDTRNTMAWQELPIRQQIPKLSLKKFLQVLTKA